MFNFLNLVRALGDESRVRILMALRHRKNAFGRLKGWRRIATRYDRCAHTFFSHLPCCWWYLSSQLMSPDPRVCLKLSDPNH